MSRIKKSYNKDILYTLIELILNSVVEDTSDFEIYIHTSINGQTPSCRWTYEKNN